MANEQTGTGKSSLEGDLSPEEREAARRSGQSLSDLAAARAPGDRKPGEDLHERQDQLVDEAVEETFPASDPISPKRITK
jgi:hypothetical protein